MINFIKKYLKNFSDQSDLIIGYDFERKIFKIYFDHATGQIDCLGLNNQTTIIEKKYCKTLEYQEIADFLNQPNLRGSRIWD